MPLASNAAQMQRRSAPPPSSDVSANTHAVKAFDTSTAVHRSLPTKIPAHQTWTHVHQNAVLPAKHTNSRTLKQRNIACPSLLNAITFGQRLHALFVVQSTLFGSVDRHILPSFRDRHPHGTAFANTCSPSPSHPTSQAFCSAIPHCAKNLPVLSPAAYASDSIPMWHYCFRLSSNHSLIIVCFSHLSCPSSISKCVSSFPRPYTSCPKCKPFDIYLLELPVFNQKSCLWKLLMATSRSSAASSTDEAAALQAALPEPPQCRLKVWQSCRSCAMTLVSSSREFLLCCSIAAIFSVAFNSVNPCPQCF